MSTTPNLGLTEVDSGVMQPSVPINDSLEVLDALTRPGGIVQDKDLTTPPTTVGGDVGKRWIVGPSATGAWSGHDGQIALCTAATVWRYFTPTEGWRVYVLDEDQDYIYSGSAWATATAAVSPVGRHMVPIMAGAIQPSVTGGCSAVTSVASAANQPDIVTVDFDATTQEYAQFSIPMPESWDEGTITFQPIWSHAATTTNFGVVWDLQAVAVSNDDAIAVAFGTAVTSTDTGGTTNDLYIGPESAAITVGGSPAAGDMVFFRLSRVTGNGSDTMAIDARLHGIRLYMTTSTATDA